MSIQALLMASPLQLVPFIHPTQQEIRAGNQEWQFLLVSLVGHKQEDEIELEGDMENLQFRDYSKCEKWCEDSYDREHRVTHTKQAPDLKQSLWEKTKAGTQNIYQSQGKNFHVSVSKAQDQCYRCFQIILRPHTGSMGQTSTFNLQKILFLAILYFEN